MRLVCYRFARLHNIVFIWIIYLIRWISENNIHNLLHQLYACVFLKKTHEWLVNLPTNIWSKSLINVDRYKSHLKFQIMFLIVEWAWCFFLISFIFFMFNIVVSYQPYTTKICFIFMYKLQTILYLNSPTSSKEVGIIMADLSFK